jgi:hypothetical protein
MDEHHNEDDDEELDNQRNNLIRNLKSKIMSKQVLEYQEYVQMAIYLKF